MKFLKKIWDKLKQFFIENRSGLNNEIATSKVAAKQRKKRAKTPDELVTLGALLENLNETFSALELPYHKLSWVPKHYIAGLRKLGVHVVHSCHRETPFENISEKLANRILPTLINVSFGDSKLDDENICHPAMLFAIKENKLPAGVNYCYGQHYLFGMGYKQNGKSNKQLFWAAGYVTVRPNGSIHLHQELKPRSQVIKRNNGKEISFIRKQWGKPNLVEIMTNPVDAENNLTRNFARVMDFWLDRKNQWSVRVGKNSQRITFSIPKELTAKFFKDRIKVKTENGTTRPIIHYVHEHERITKRKTTVVRAHIRGLAKFEWKEYSCCVTAPEFNGRLTSTFTIPAEVFEDDEPLPNVKMMNLSKVATVLVNLEEAA